MNALDWAIVAVIVLSVGIGLWRGLVRELLSLAGWIAGVVLALLYSPAVGATLPFDAAWTAARTALAALLIVLGCVVVAHLAAWVIGKLLQAVHLSGVDRTFGALFGLLRAALVLFLVVIFVGRTELARQPIWRESMLMPHLQAAVRFAAPLLPPVPAVGQRI